MSCTPQLDHLSLMGETHQLKMVCCAVTNTDRLGALVTFKVIKLYFF